jgi:hypothetical protein
MRTIELLFGIEGDVSLTGGELSGSRTVVQNALVNLLSDFETDLTFPDRGTEIMEAAVQSGVGGIRGAQHEANYAANRILFFSRTYDRADAENRLENVELKARVVGGGLLDLEAGFLTESGENLSYPIQTESAI